MVKKTRFTILILVALLLIPAVATLFLNKADTKQIVESYVESATGRALNIEGDLGAQWGWLSPTLYVESVSLANSHWARTPFVFQSERVNISLSIVGLLTGKLKVTAIELEKPVFWVERHPESEIFNTDFRSSEYSGNADTLLPEWLMISQLIVNNGQGYFFHENRDWEIEIDSARADSPGQDLKTNVEFNGAVENTAVSVAGTLGSLNKLLRFQESEIALDGYVGVLANQVSVSGVIQDLFSWIGLNLWFDANVSNLAGLSELVGFALPPYEDISASWELIQPETSNTMRLESIRLNSRAHGLMAYAEGEIGHAVELNEVKIQFKAEGNLDKKLISPNLSDGVNLETAVRGTISGDRDNLILNLEQGQMTTNGIFVSASGTVTNLLYDWQSPLSVNARIESLDLLGQAIDTKLPASPAIDISVNLLKKDSKFNLEDIMAKGESNIGTLHSSGSLFNVSAEPTGNLDFDLEFKISVLSDQFSESNYLPLFDRAAVKGDLEISHNQFGISNLALELIGDGVLVMGTGQIENIAKRTGVNIDSRLELDSISRLQSLVVQTLPETNPFIATGILNSNTNGDISLLEIQGNLNDPSLELELSGMINQIVKSPEPDLDISWLLKSAAPVSTMYPDLGYSGLLNQLMPVSGNGELTANNENGILNYDVSNIELETLSEQFSGHLRGEVVNFVPGEGQTSANLSGKLSLSLTGVVDEQSITTEQAGIFEPSVLSGNIKATLDIIFSDATVGLDKIDLKIKSDKKNITAQGSIDRISPLVSRGFILTFDTDALGDLIKNIEPPLILDQPANGKLEFDNIGDTQNARLGIVLGKNDISGNIIFDNTGVIDYKNLNENFIARLHSRRLDLTEILQEDENPQRLFSEGVIDFSWLDETTAEISFDADYFKNSIFIFSDVDLKTQVENGKLRTSVFGDSSKGQVKLQFALDKNNKGVDGELLVDGQGVDVSALTNAEKLPEDEAGIFNLNIGLKGVGNSLSTLAGSANGKILLELDKAQIKSDGLKLLSQDIFFGLIKAINPLSKREEYMDVECGVVYFEVENGNAKADQGFALKTSEFSVLGGGEINFGNENIELVFTTKARKGFGINTNSFAKLVRVGGTIQKPEIETDPKGLLQTGVAIGAAIFSGGLSLLAQGLYDKNKANSDVCKFAKEGKQNLSDENIDPTTETK